MPPSYVGMCLQSPPGSSIYSYINSIAAILYILQKYHSCQYTQTLTLWGEGLVKHIYQLRFAHCCIDIKILEVLGETTVVQIRAVYTRLQFNYVLSKFLDTVTQSWYMGLV